VIVCPRCSKENQDHYKFCLGCGSELPRDAGAHKHFSAPTPPSAMPAVGVAPTQDAPRGDKNLQFAATQQGDASILASAIRSQAAPAPARPASAAPPRSVPASAANNCPSCGNPVPQDFKFCGTCGHRMEPAAAAARSVPAAAPAPAPSAAPRAQPAAAPRGALVLINPDGSQGDSFALGAGATVVGREAGGVFAHDAYLSPRHATFTFQGDQCSVKDESSLNGVYLKIERDVPTSLIDGSTFRIGQEILRFQTIKPVKTADGVEPMGSPNPGYIGRISLLIGRDATGNAFPIPREGMHIGRERGDVIFPEDGYVSGLHCRIHHDGSGVVLTDVGSSNGTFTRVRGEAKIGNGQLLLMGQQLFRLQF
jgi:pSer/pThr/pTyr-binding forkhead associated (FHA) protein